MADELTAAEVMRITDETGVCPACGATAERVEVRAGIALFWAHVPPCPAAIDPSFAVMSEVKPIDDELQEWERKFVDGEAL